MFDNSSIHADGWSAAMLGFLICWGLFGLNRKVLWAAWKLGRWLWLLKRSPKGQ
jgi:hypothetical protein